MDNINKELEELAESIIEDFKNRQQERKRYEANWQLNINFFIGNQYCAINNNNEVVDFEKQCNLLTCLAYNLPCKGNQHFWNMWKDVYTLDFL